MDTLDSVPAAVKPARRTTRQLYQPIDIHSQTLVWPEVIPPLTAAEAIKAARLLHTRFAIERFYEERHGMGRAAYYRKIGRKLPAKRAMPVKVTSGHRYNWPRHGNLVVNPERGWRNLVHDYSHYIHRQLRPKDSPHSDSHRHLEKEMIAYVVGSGWLDGKLKPKPRVARPAKPKPDPAVVEHEKVLARLKAWETKAKRAATAIAKLKKLEKRLAKKRPLFTL